MAMQSGAGGEDGGLITEINVTPMVDIMLVLLVIFMVTAPAMLLPSIKVELPEARTTESISEQEMGVVIDRDGKWYLNGEEVDRDSLQRKIADLISAGVDPVVLVSADRQVEHGVFVGLLDFLRAHGVGKFAINTAPPPVGK